MLVCIAVILLKYPLSGQLLFKMGNGIDYIRIYFRIKNSIVTWGSFEVLSDYLIVDKWFE